jgi:pimeloyl-ACP methyl ester carboxylesterase
LERGETDLTESGEFQAMTRELATRWPELLPGVSKSRIEGAGHYIQKDKPELVATEIGVLVTTAQGGRR